VLLVLQRYGQSSLFKRTVLDCIAEELLLMHGPDELACRLEGSKPVMASPSDSVAQQLYDALQFKDGARVVDRDTVADGITRLGERRSSALLRNQTPGSCQRRVS
jgi:hypothetical protein